MAWNMTWLAGGDPHEHGTWKHDLPKVICHTVVRIVGQRKVSPSPVLARRMAALDWLRYMLNYMHNV